MVSARSNIPLSNSEGSCRLLVLLEIMADYWKWRLLLIPVVTADYWSYWRLQQIIEDYWRLLLITVVTADYWRLLASVGDYWSILQITGINIFQPLSDTSVDLQIFTTRTRTVPCHFEIRHCSVLLSQA